jgi:hypothetical protein
MLSRGGARDRSQRPTLLHVAHGASSIGWFGAVTLVGFFAVSASSTGDRTLAHVLYRAIDTSLPVTLAFGILALGTGVALGLGTEWGILRHWWVCAKLLIALAVLIADVFIVHHEADVALHTASAPGALVGAAVGHAVALPVAAILAVYKPWGLTPLARRRAGAESLNSREPGGLMGSSVEQDGG